MSTKAYLSRNIGDYSGSPAVGDLLRWNGTTWSPYLPALNDLDEVVVGSPSTGQILIYNGENWVNVAHPSHPIDDLIDVNITTPANNAVLKYDNTSGSWVDGSLTLDDLSDVVSGTPNNGERLTWNAGQSRWEPMPDSGSAPAPLYISVFNESMSTTGSDFTTAYEFIAGTLRVTWNGVRQASTQFTEKISHLGFTTSFLRSSDDVLIVDYHRSASTGSQGGWWDGNALKLQNRDISTVEAEDGQGLIWNSGENKWQPQDLVGGSSGSSGFSIDKSVHFIWDDFDRWSTPLASLTGTATNSGTAMNGGATSANHPGVVALACSASSGSSGYGYFTQSHNIWLAGNEEFLCVFAITYNHSGVWARIGYQSPLGLWQYPSHGAFLNVLGNYAYGMTARWPNRTSTSTGYSLTVNTYYTTKIVVNSNATRIDFYLYSEGGVQLWSDYITTDIPNSSGYQHELGFFGGCSYTPGSSTSMVAIDYFYAKRPGLVR